MSTSRQQLMHAMREKIAGLSRDFLALESDFSAASAEEAKKYVMLPYEALVEWLMSQLPHDIAMYRAVGCKTLEEFRHVGDTHVAVLRHNGLRDGMSIYDLGCGSGRTAQALLRAGWSGVYKGADIVQALVDYLNAHVPGSPAVVNRNLDILADDSSLDIVFHWSVFTHLFPEECYVYLADIFRTLKPGGRLVFSFLEMESEPHRRLFAGRVSQFRSGNKSGHLDTFLHRDWIVRWAGEIGFTGVRFTDGADAARHPAFWQTLVAMDKPAPPGAL